MDIQEYRTTCLKMIILNRKQVNETEKQLKEETNPKKRAQLELELEGWLEWVAQWQRWYKNAGGKKLDGE